MFLVFGKIQSLYLVNYLTVFKKVQRIVSRCIYHGNIAGVGNKKCVLLKNVACHYEKFCFLHVCYVYIKNKKKVVDDIIAKIINEKFFK